jgi:hypothetical protein
MDGEMDGIYGRDHHCSKMKERLCICSDPITKSMILQSVR